MKNLPEKRIGENEKQYTPPLLTLNCGGDGNLQFVVEDIESIILTTKGAAIKIGNNDVRIVRV